MYLSVNYEVTFIYCQSVMCHEINKSSALREKKFIFKKKNDYNNIKNTFEP